MKRYPVIHSKLILRNRVYNLCLLAFFSLLIRKTIIEFLDDQVFEKGVVMLGIAEPTLELIGMANHGLEVLGDPFEVTENLYTII
jgi:hypothetical protein